MRQIMTRFAGRATVVQRRGPEEEVSEPTRDEQPTTPREVTDANQKETCRQKNDPWRLPEIPVIGVL